MAAHHTSVTWLVTTLHPPLVFFKKKKYVCTKIPAFI